MSYRIRRNTNDGDRTLTFRFPNGAQVTVGIDDGDLVSSLKMFIQRELLGHLRSGYDRMRVVYMKDDQYAILNDNVALDQDVVVTMPNGDEEKISDGEISIVVRDVDLDDADLDHFRRNDGDRTLTFQFPSGDLVTVGIDDGELVSSLKMFIQREQLGDLRSGYGRMQVVYMKDDQYTILDDNVALDQDVVMVTMPNGDEEKISDGEISIVVRDVDLDNLNGLIEDLRGENLSGKNLSNQNLSGIRLDWADLNLADLSGAILGRELPRINLSGANLTGAEFIESNLDRADLSGANLTGAEFISSNLDQANLSGANLLESRFGPGLGERCTIIRCNFTGADLSRAEFTASNLYQLDLSRANLAGAKFIYSNFYQADLSGANLLGSRFERGQIRRCNFTGADFSGAQILESLFDNVELLRCNFSNAFFRQAYFYEADLRGCNFSRVNIHNTELRLCNLEGNNLSGAQIFVTDLSYAKLHGANLTDAKLVKSNLTGANLSVVHAANLFAVGCDFFGADLSVADLRGANLASSNFNGACLVGADLRGSILRHEPLVNRAGAATRLHAPTLTLHCERVGCSPELATQCADCEHTQQAPLDRSLSPFEYNLAIIRRTTGGCSFIGAHLARALLDGVDLSDIDLTNADLRGANLSGAILRGANLTGALLDGADLSDIDLTTFNHSGVDLSNAILVKSDFVVENGDIPSFPHPSSHDDPMQHKWEFRRHKKSKQSSRNK